MLLIGRDFRMAVARWLIFLTASTLAACGGNLDSNPPAPGPRYAEASADYLALLSRFPAGAMGVGEDPFLATGETADHLEIYALILSAEARRWAATRDPDSADRIRESWSHLMQTRYLYGEGEVGWGIPLAWDAFADGSQNPKDWPYTISTAQVLEAFFDAIELAGPLFSASEVSLTEDVIKEAWTRWATAAWSQDGERGWFWYSPAAVDSENVINVNGMMLSVAARGIGHTWSADDLAFLTSIKSTALILTRTLLGEVEYRSGSPFWTYIAVPNRYDSQGPNDVVHHVYILWGLERARDLAQEGVVFPYTREQALNSIGMFLRSGSAYDYPQDITYAGDSISFNDRPMILWGLGASLAFLGEYGSTSNPNLQELLQILPLVYGPIPDLRLWPTTFSADNNFYPRYAVHVLWGLSTITYGSANSLAPLAK